MGVRCVIGRRRGKLRTAALAALAIVLAVGLAGAAAKKKKRGQHGRPPVFPSDAGGSRACATAALPPDECLGELGRRGIHFRKAEPSPGVRTPVRLLGPVGGVLYRTDYPDAQRPSVPFEVFDCRLVVALSDLSVILKEHEIEDVRLFSAWRPPARELPTGKILDAHPGGLAADLRLFKKSSGSEIEVKVDFHGRIGADPCGPAAVPPAPATDGARELRSILCATADARLFHLVLSPNFDARHYNHFHVEVRPGVRWFIVR